jgi:hypothetical protein
MNSAHIVATAAFSVLLPQFNNANAAGSWPALSSVEIVIGHSAGRGAGMRWSEQRPIAPENQRQPLGVTKRPCRSVVGRLRDTFGKEANGVSILQHSRNIASLATCLPRECLIGLASYPPRAVRRGDDTRTRPRSLS